MPDVWTKHPDIVRELLKEGGFACGVTPRVLKGRDPAWTCVIDGKRISGDLYIHHVDALRSGLGIQDASLHVVLLAAVFVTAWRMRCR